jgi:ribosomal protein S18 acetylase RimI-like enzyme
VDAKTLSIRSATSADIAPLAAVLARSFYDDPPFAWVLPDPRSRMVRLERIFATILRAEISGHGISGHDAVDVAVSGDRLAGGAIWMPPGGWPPGIREQLVTLPSYLRALGRRFPAGSNLTGALARVHPREPHWYLSTIGVEPDCQGRGIAGSLLRPRLRVCDRTGQPAYLESSKPGNVPLYQHFGFQSTGTPALPDGAPVITAMWRSPGPPDVE